MKERDVVITWFDSYKRKTVKEKNTLVGSFPFEEKNKSADIVQTLFFNNKGIAVDAEYDLAEVYETFGKQKFSSLLEFYLNFVAKFPFYDLNKKDNGQYFIHVDLCKNYIEKSTSSSVTNLVVLKGCISEVLGFQTIHYLTNEEINGILCKQMNKNAKKNRLICIASAVLFVFFCYIAFGPMSASSVNGLPLIAGLVALGAAIVMFFKQKHGKADAYKVKVGKIGFPKPKQSQRSQDAFANRIIPQKKVAPTTSAPASWVPNPNVKKMMDRLFGKENFHYWNWQNNFVDKYCREEEKKWFELSVASRLEGKYNDALSYMYKAFAANAKKDGGDENGPIGISYDSIIEIMRDLLGLGYVKTAHTFVIKSLLKFRTAYDVKKFDESEQCRNLWTYSGIIIDCIFREYGLTNLVNQKYVSKSGHTIDNLCRVMGGGKNFVPVRFLDTSENRAEQMIGKCHDFLTAEKILREDIPSIYSVSKRFVDEKIDK
ncbi:MAG: hypothetical protein J1F32_02410 [Erysipelotrichales bacterium]|nr:hypothetical protein [Erysipelotrichales bacterium]